MDRSIFTVEEDPNSPWDLQIVSKRYIRGNDEVLEVGSDSPLKPNPGENFETEEVGDEGSDESTGIGDSQEILWTERYQGFAAEGVPPAEDRPVFDMISGAELGDDFMKDDSCEIPGMVRHDSGMGADQLFVDLPEPVEDKAPEVPWIPVRKAWYNKSALDVKDLKRIAKEENVDPKHYDVRQRLLEQGPHTFAKTGKTEQGYLIVVEVKTNCLQKHFPAQSKGMNDFFAPPVEQDVFRKDFLSGAGVGDFFAPPAEQDVFRSSFLSDTGDFFAPAVERDIYRGQYIGIMREQRAALEDMKRYSEGFKKTADRIEDIARHKLKSISRKGGAEGVGAINLTFTPFTPKKFVPFANLSKTLQTPRPVPEFQNMKNVLASGFPQPKRITVPTFDFKEFAVSEAVAKEIQTATDEITKVVTMWTNKSPEWEFKWTEQFGSSKNTYRGKSPNFVTAMYNANAELVRLYTFKDGDPVNNVLRAMNYSTAVRQLMSQYVEQLIGSLSTAFNQLVKSGKASYNVLSKLPKEVLDTMKENVNRVKENITATTTMLYDSLKEYMTALGAFISQIMDAIKNDILNLSTWFKNVLLDIQQAVIKDAGELQQGVVGIFNDFITWIKTNMGNFSTQVSNEVKSMLTQATDAATKIVAGVRKDATDLVNKTTADMKALYTELGTKFTAAVDKVKADFIAVTDKITKDFNDAYAKLVATLTGTIDVVKKQGEMLTAEIKKVTDLRAAYEKFVQETGQRFGNIEAKVGEVSAKAAEKKGLFASMFSGIKRHAHLGAVRAPPRRAPVYRPIGPPSMNDFGCIDGPSFLTSGFHTEVDGFV
jgi:hypothetical protein